MKKLLKFSKQVGDLIRVLISVIPTKLLMKVSSDFELKLSIELDGHSEIKLSPFFFQICLNNS